MKRLLMAVVVAVAVSGVAVAGDIPTADFVPPPPPAESSTTSIATDPGDIPTADATISVQQILISTLFGLLVR